MYNHYKKYLDMKSCPIKCGSLCDLTKDISVENEVANISIASDNFVEDVAIAESVIQNVVPDGTENDNIVDVAMTDDTTVDVIIDESILINVIHDADEYDGPYVVDPHTKNDVVLNTNNKVMKRDVTVKKIAYFETHNDFGETIYIGSEI